MEKISNRNNIVESGIILNEFQMRNVKILSHLLRNDALDNEMIDFLHQIELDYFALEEKLSLLEQKINIDEKTNLLKFRKDYLTNIIKTASRIYHGLANKVYHISLVRFDIDDFSVFNNTYGHDIGDKVLLQLATLIKENSRPTDYVIRFGGEEFDVILPATPLHGTKIYLQKIFSKIEETNQGLDTMFRATVSAGVSCLEYSFSDEKHLKEHEISQHFQKLQQQADHALYEAKYLGKNCFAIFSPEKMDKYYQIRKCYLQH